MFKLDLIVSDTLTDEHLTGDKMLGSFEATAISGEDNCAEIILQNCYRTVPFN